MRGRGGPSGAAPYAAVQHLAVQYFFGPIENHKSQEKASRKA